MHSEQGGLTFPDLLFVRRTLFCALQERDGVALLLPFLGVSSLDFGPLLRGWPFFLSRAGRRAPFEEPPRRGLSRLAGRSQGCHSTDCFTLLPYSAAMRGAGSRPTAAATAETIAVRLSVSLAKSAVRARLDSFM